MAAGFQRCERYDCFPEEVIGHFKATRVVVQGGLADTQLPVVEYFLRDTCLHMVEAEEERNSELAEEKGWEHKWILYAGLDQVWFGPPPNVSRLDPKLQGLTVETTVAVPTPTNYKESRGGIPRQAKGCAMRQR